jgi:anti-repressor protein
MNELKVFNNEEFGEVRTITIDNEVWFVGKDVAEKLEYQNGSRDIERHTDEEDRRIIPIFDGTQNRNTLMINESGLYSLVIGSKMPKAKDFKHWITSEVLPSIRKNGGYISGQENMSDTELLAKAIMLSQNIIAERDKLIEKQKQQIEADKPKVLFADAVSTSKKSILVGDLAKILNQNGMNTGQNRLFEQLRNEGYLVSRRGESFNTPTQKSMDLKIMELKESVAVMPDGSTRTNKTTKITGKGQIYFVNRYLGKEAVVDEQ